MDQIPMGKRESEKFSSWKDKICNLSDLMQFLAKFTYKYCQTIWPKFRQFALGNNRKIWGREGGAPGERSCNPLLWLRLRKWLRRSVSVSLGSPGCRMRRRDNSCQLNPPKLPHSKDTESGEISQSEKLSGQRWDRAKNIQNNKVSFVIW